VDWRVSEEYLIMSSTYWPRLLGGGGGGWGDGHRAVRHKVGGVCNNHSTVFSYMQPEVYVINERIQISLAVRRK